jgi:hypothetical protein
VGSATLLSTGDLLERVLLSVLLDLYRGPEATAPSR